GRIQGTCRRRRNAMAREGAACAGRSRVRGRRRPRKRKSRSDRRGDWWSAARDGTKGGYTAGQSIRGWERERRAERATAECAAAKRAAECAVPEFAGAIRTAK